jgi:catalase
MAGPPGVRLAGHIRRQGDAVAVPPRPVVVRADRFEPSAEQWSPHRWTSELGPALVAALRQLLKAPPSDRPAHRHGVVWEGHFTPSGEAAGLSDFAGFRGPQYCALARFSSLFRQPGEPDIMGMATKLMPGGEISDLVAMSAEVFPVRRSRQFLALLETLQERPFRLLPSIAGMLASRQLSARAVLRGVVAAVRNGDFQTTTFHGVHTFHLVRGAGPATPPERHPVRYRWVPGGSAGGEAAGSEAGKPRFTLELVLGHPGWKRLYDPTWRWPRHAPTVRAGELVLVRRLAPEPKLAFNPAVLAPGIEPGADDLFSDRVGAYAVAQASRD